jgi:hypothetical protein
VEIGDLVLICPGDATVGIYLGEDEPHAYDPMFPELCRSMVLFDEDIYTVPTFQLEIINESR